LGGALLGSVGAVGVWAGMAVLTVAWAALLSLSHLTSPDAVEVA